MSSRERQHLLESCHTPGVVDAMLRASSRVSIFLGQLGQGNIPHITPSVEIEEYFGTKIERGRHFGTMPGGLLPG